MVVKLSILLLSICLGAIAFLKFSFTITTVNGKSMIPTLEDADRLLTFSLLPRVWLRRGQIVVGKMDALMPSLSVNIIFPDDIDGLSDFASDTEYSSETEVESISLKPGCLKFIKRITGLPGDTIRIPLSSLHEVMQAGLRPQADPDGNLVWYVPNHYCFVRGDSPVCLDSLTVGPIPIASITGIALLKLPHRSPSKLVLPSL